MNLWEFYPMVYLMFFQPKKLPLSILSYISYILIFSIAGIIVGIIVSVIMGLKISMITANHTSNYKYYSGRTTLYTSFASATTSL